MSIIKAYKSDEDNKIFEHLADYDKHLKKLSNEKEQTQKLEKQKDSKVKFLKNMFEEVTSPDELVEFIKKNEEFFYLNSKRLHSYRKSNKQKPDLIFKDIYIQKDYNKDISSNNSLQWSNHVSSYHCAPIGKKTNWGGQNKNDPSDYPGWTGMIHISTHKKDIFESDFFSETGIHTGTGGSGSLLAYQYSIEIFAHDFRKMAYCEMLKDFERNPKSVDLKRIKHVMKLSLKYFDFEDPRCNTFIEYVRKVTPEHSAIIADILLKKNLEVKNKVDSKEYKSSALKML